MAHGIDRRDALNTAATILPHQADRDYITARYVYPIGFADQFMWQAEQAIEKYLKATLLFASVLPHEGGNTQFKSIRSYGHRLDRLVEDVQKVEPAWKSTISQD